MKYPFKQLTKIGQSVLLVPPFDQSCKTYAGKVRRAAYNYSLRQLSSYQDEEGNPAMPKFSVTLDKNAPGYVRLTRVDDELF